MMKKKGKEKKNKKEKNKKAVFGRFFGRLNLEARLPNDIAKCGKV